MMFEVVFVSFFSKCAIVSSRDLLIFHTCHRRNYSVNTIDETLRASRLIDKMRLSTLNAG